MIIKKGWFSNLEILIMHQQINMEARQQDPNTIIDTSNTEKQEHSNRNEPQKKTKKQKKQKQSKYHLPKQHTNTSRKRRNENKDVK